MLNGPVPPMIGQPRFGIPRPPVAGAPGVAAPAGAPMTVPQQHSGLVAAAIVKVQTAIKLLEQSVPVLGASSDDGQAVLGALKTIGARFGGNGDASQSLQPAEVLAQMAAIKQAPSVPGPGGAPNAPPPPRVGI